MAEKRIDPPAAPAASAPSKPAAEVRGNGAAAESAEKPIAAAGGAGGFKSWVPLIVTVLLMPLLAYGMTTFVLAPRLQRAIGSPAPDAGADPGARAEEAKPAAETHGAKDAKTTKAKITVPLNKVLVNVSGTMGTRYLMTSLTLVGYSADFKEKIEANKDQLMDIAASTLSSKTISDLEKPGARNLIRTELISVFNTTLGVPLVQEIYLTEFAIQ